GIGDGEIDAFGCAEREALALGGVLGFLVNRERVVRERSFVPRAVQRRAIRVGAGVGHEDGAVGPEDEVVLVEMTVAPAVGAIFQAEPGCVVVGALLEDGKSTGDKIARSASSAYLRGDV